MLTSFYFINDNKYYLKYINKIYIPNNEYLLVIIFITIHFYYNVYLFILRLFALLAHSVNELKYSTDPKASFINSG